MKYNYKKQKAIINISRLHRLYLLPLFVALASCAVSPTYVNDAELARNNLTDTSLNPVHYNIEESFKDAPPQCVAILPLVNKFEHQEKNLIDKTKKLIELTDESLEQLRWSLYSQLAPYSYRDVELVVVNQALDLLDDKTNYSLLGKALKCDALLIAEVTDYQSGFFGVYSETSIGIKMKLIRAENGEQLWQGSHVAKNHGGSVPLSPIGIIMGLYSAAENLSEEQLVRVKDDVFRRLLSTWQQPSEQLNSAIQLALEEPVKEDYPFNIVVENLFLRSGPGTKYEPATVLDQNDKIAIVHEKFSPWVQVKVEDGLVGFVKNKYLTIAKQPNKVASFR